MNAFTVMPMSQRFELEPGKIYSGSITVTNPADATSDFYYKVAVTPYGVIGEDYGADLVSVTDRTQIVDWIKIDEPTGNLEPNESREVNFTISVPENALSGGQYAAITVSSNDKIDSSSNVAVNNVFELASLIYANVAGETIHEGEILENSVPGFVLSPPATTSAAFTNTGNVHEDAIITIVATNLITGEKILPNEEQDGHYSELIMPGTTRFTTRDISNLPSLGIVNIEQTIYYNGDKSIVEQNMIICPIWFMVLIAITVGVILAIIVRIIQKHRHKKVTV